MKLNNYQRYTLASLALKFVGGLGVLLVDWRMAAFLCIWICGDMVKPNG